LVSPPALVLQLGPSVGFLVKTVEGIRGYQFPSEKEDYTTDDPSSMDVDIDPQLVGRAHPEAQHSTQRSNLRLFPPPIFSRQGIPQNYKCVHSLLDWYAQWCLVLLTFHGRDSASSFKPNPMSTATIVVDEKTGEEKERLINKGRWKGYGPTSVSFSEKGVGASSYSSSAAPQISNAMYNFRKVPTKPPSNVEEVRNQYDQTLVQQLEEVKSRILV